jgi:uncharacterized protein (DUF1501 family)
VRLLGFDTHTNQLQLHPLLLGALSAALFAFQSALEELGVAQDVTTCTLSEFGRSLSSNGKGTDHGWGSVQLVLGGSVQGGDLYGTMPDLAPDGPDDLGGGRILPTTAVEQYAATLGAWLGLSGPTLAQTFPNLGNFGAANLGFLG